MSRVSISKELTNTRLANGYGGWIYCEGCNKTIGYLCYVTYDSFSFSYRCNCGGEGKMQIAFVDDKSAPSSEEPLPVIKNRSCCPADQSPLFTVLEKNLESYDIRIVCKACNRMFSQEKGRDKI